MLTMMDEKRVTSHVILLAPLLAVKVQNDLDETAGIVMHTVLLVYK